MKKGQMGAIILIVIALVIAAVFFLPQFFQPQPTTAIKYKNDVITLEDFTVSNLKPIKGNIVTIKFSVVNNGDKEVKNLVIDFSEFTRGGLKLLPDADQTKCEIVNPATDLADIAHAKCTYGSLQSFDSRAITIVFQVTAEANLNLDITVSYYYSGTREALIPVIDSTTVKTSPIQFRQSQPSVGPIVLDITLPTKSFGFGKEPFEVKFKFRHIGSVAGKLDPNFKIEKGEFAASLIDLEARKKVGATESIGGVEWQSCKKFSSGFGACDFKTSPLDIPCDLVFGTNSKGQNALVNSEDIKIDKGVFKDKVCNLQSTVVPSGYKVTTIQAEFFYTYKFTKSQPIVVQVIK